MDKNFSLVLEFQFSFGPFLGCSGTNPCFHIGNANTYCPLSPSPISFAKFNHVTMILPLPSPSLGVRTPPQTSSTISAVVFCALSSSFAHAHRHQTRTIKTAATFLIFLTSHLSISIFFTCQQFACSHQCLLQ